MARDNFSASVKQKLRERVGNKCSNPACENVTTGPGLEPEKVVHLGDAAHICAASPEGPRYDSSMSSEQRKSISNGIWLCTSCARRIDHDENFYSVELLHEWKRTAETKALDELGKPAINKTTVSKQVAAILTATPSLAHDVISNAHKSVTSGLEQLDPRFIVESRFENNHPIYEISTKEDVKFGFKIKSDPSDDLGLKINRLFEEGEDLSIPGSSILETGSPLLDHIFKSSNKNEGTATLSFSAPRKKAIIKIYLEDERGNRTLEIDDVHGYCQSGFKVIRFFGGIFDDLIDFIIKFTLGDSVGAKITINPKLKTWNNLSVDNLQSIDEMHKFCLCILNDDKLVIRIKGVGQNAINSKATLMDLKDLANYVLSIIFYIKRVSLLSKIINKPIYFKDCEIKEDDFNALKSYTAHGLPNTINKIDTIPGGLIKSTVILDDEKEVRRIIDSSTSPFNFKIKDRENSSILVFDQEFFLPKKIFSFHGVIPKIKGVGEDEGQRVAFMEWTPTEDFYWTVDYSYDD